MSGTNLCERNEAGPARQSSQAIHVCARDYVSFRLSRLRAGSFGDGRLRTQYLKRVGRHHGTSIVPYASGLDRRFVEPGPNELDEAPGVAIQDLQAAAVLVLDADAVKTTSRSPPAC
jgi:hypothetical protein